MSKPKQDGTERHRNKAPLRHLASGEVAQHKGPGHGPSEEDHFRTRQILRAAIDVTPDVYFVKDWEHRLLLVSRSLSEAMGKDCELMEGHLDSEFWPLDECEGDPQTGRRGYHDEDREALQGVSTRTTERVVLGDGVEHIFHTDRVPLRDAKGNVFGILGYARDVTAPILLDKRTKELEATANELRETNVRLSEEVVARQQAQAALRNANEELEERVRDRTRALSEKIAQYEHAQAYGSRRR